MNLHTVLNTLVQIICTLLYFVPGLYLYRLLTAIVSKRQGKIWTLLIFLSCSVLVNMIIFPNDTFNVSMDFIWFAALMLICFQGKAIPKLSLVAVLYPLIISFNFLVMEILGHIWGLFSYNFYFGLFCSLTDSALHILFWALLYKVFSKRLGQSTELFDDKTWLLLDSVCFASMVSITTSIYFSPEETMKLWPNAIACLVTNIGSLFLANYFVNSIRHDMERKNLTLQKAYYEELEQNQIQLRKFRHDMRNHLSVIRSFFDTGNTGEAAQYFDQLEIQMEAHNRTFCKNSIVNAVLNAKYNLAAEHGIDCFFHIDLQNLLSIDDISLCSLFSNTLDNAIEACQKIPDPALRHISLKARSTKDGWFSYEISNSKCNPVREQKGKILSDKADSSSHGMGLSNVREIVEKYGGTFAVSHTESSFTVTVLIGYAN